MILPTWHTTVRTFPTTWITALHDLNTALCERAVIPWSSVVELSHLRQRKVSIRTLFIIGNQEIIDVRKCQTVDSSFRRSFDAETRLCCQGSPSLTCHVFFNSFPPRARRIREPAHRFSQLCVRIGGVPSPTLVTVVQPLHNVALLPTASALSDHLWDDLVWQSLRFGLSRRGVCFTRGSCTVCVRFHRQTISQIDSSRRMLIICHETLLRSFLHACHWMTKVDCEFNC